MKKISIIAIFTLGSLIFAQHYNPKGFDCVIPSGVNTQSAPDLIGGLHKPESIGRYTNNPDAVFPVLIVYVQFLNDPGPDWEGLHWRRNQPSNYMGNVIARYKRINTDWWNAYDENTETLSDYWMEVSRGELHLVGQEVHVILPHEVSWYNQFEDGLQKAMEDLLIALQNNPDIYWLNYDRWSRDANGVFHYERDGFVDMIYIVGRSNPCSPYSPGWGYFRPSGIRDNCTHNNGDHVLYVNGPDTVKARATFDMQGSGFQISPGGCGNGVLYAPLDKWAMISFSGHEHGHYFFGYGNFFEYHQQYSKVNNYHGLEEYLSPYELMRLGYHIPQEVNFTITNNYSLNDFVSFDANSYSQMLKVPIGDANRNEFFIIANRQHVSRYDKLMWGDTAHDNPYRNINPEYGKGVYIYHAYPGQVGQGYPWGINIDIECADGLWNWVQNGTRYPDWSCNQQVEYYKRNEVVYDTNDNGGEIEQRLRNHDGLSIYTWFGMGKRENPICQYGDGTDRIFTNEEDYWTSREWKGDRWDAWKVGYNQVFSPYSSPSTVNWDHQQRGFSSILKARAGLLLTLGFTKSVKAVGPKMQYFRQLRHLNLCFTDPLKL